jgi:hypothetical protein
MDARQGDSPSTLTFYVLKQQPSSQEIKLGLNCVGGKPTSLLAGYLGHNAALVSYGAMSMSPLSLPTSLFIFKVNYLVCGTPR